MHLVQIQSPLFAGFSLEEQDALLSCLCARRKRYAKGECILRRGMYVEEVGLILEGQVCIEHTDIWGRLSILDKLGPGGIFAEAYACASHEPLMVDVRATAECEVVFLRIGDTLEGCSQSCRYHQRLIKNLLVLSAQKNLSLSRKILHTSPKTIRERVKAYLSSCVLKARNARVYIPFNRQELADYLQVDRSALSHELSVMQREGILQVHKNEFILADVSAEYREEIPAKNGR